MPESFCTAGDLELCYETFGDPADPTALLVRMDLDQHEIGDFGLLFDLDDPDVVAPLALELLRAYAPPRPVRLLGVRVAGFVGDEEHPEPAAPDGQLALGLDQRSAA